MLRWVAVLFLLIVAGCAADVAGPVPVYQPTTAPGFQSASTLPAAAAPAMLPATAPGISVTVPPAQPVVGMCRSRLFLPGTNYEAIWDATVDVVDDFFEIDQEEPVRLLGNILTEGRILTRAEIGPTIFEPWRRTSVGLQQRVESTLQSIRRYAEIRVLPGENGLWVEVAVFKELEDVVQPEQATAGAATFRNDSSLVRVETPIGQQEVHQGWIPMGRDVALEQEMLGELQLRVGTAPRFVSGL